MLCGVGNSQTQALCRQQVDSCVPGLPHVSTLVTLSFCCSRCLVVEVVEKASRGFAHLVCSAVCGLGQVQASGSFLGRGVGG